MDSAITSYLRPNYDCLIGVCCHVFDYFSVGARASNHFHLDVLEAVYIKLHSPACFVQTKGICESFVFGVNITP